MLVHGSVVCVCVSSDRTEFADERQHARLNCLCSGLPESTVVTTSGVTTMSVEPSTSVGSTVMTSM